MNERAKDWHKQGKLQEALKSFETQHKLDSGNIAGRYQRNQEIREVLLASNK